MKKGLLKVSAMFVVCLAASGVVVNAQVQNRRQTASLVSRVQTKTAQFRRYTQNWTNRPNVDNTNREERIETLLSNFESSTSMLRQNLVSRQDSEADVTDVLTSAAAIDRFVARNRFSLSAQNQWNSIRNDLNLLARNYNVAWNWNSLPNDGGYGNAGGGVGRGFDARLTGTYRLNRTQSDNIAPILDRYGNATSNVQGDRIRRNLERRLTPPDMIAIEKAGTSVTLGSTLSPQVTFQADGVARTETNRNGRSIRTTANANRDNLLISYEGDRANDFYLTFSPLRDGQLRVTRRLYLENSNETVSVTSVYDKINNVAEWSSVNTGATWAGSSNDTYRDFAVPNGTALTATLRNTVNTSVSQVNDRFTLEVTAPNEYRGAVIEGRLAEAQRSGRVSGRASLTFDFNTIRMPNGQTYRFAGILNSVQTANGDNVSVTNEGTVRDSNQTTKTVTRAGIGAALGAIIGAVAGGGEGAAIGAAVGAGAGAGTVFIQGRDNVELAPGTIFNLTATAPGNTGYYRN